MQTAHLFKRATLLTLLVSLSLLFPVATYASKQEQSPLPEVVIESSAQAIPLQAIEDIMNDHPDAAVITIHEWHEPQPAVGSFVNPNSFPIIIYQFKITEKKVINANTVYADHFVISAAKGQTVRLTSTWTKELAASVSGEGGGALSLNATVSKTYTKQDEFVGPPESSANNTREYRVRFYADTGTYKGYKYPGAQDFPEMRTYFSGTFVNPLRFASYSIDRKI